MEENPTYSWPYSGKNWAKPFIAFLERIPMESLLKESSLLLANFVKDPGEWKCIDFSIISSPGNTYTLVPKNLFTALLTMGEYVPYSKLSGDTHILDNLKYAG